MERVARVALRLRLPEARPDEAHLLLLALVTGMLGGWLLALV